MKIEPWTLQGAEGEPIAGDAHLPSDSPTGVVIMCHGFKGYKDYGFFPRLAKSIAERGSVAHRFNFSHSGMTRDIEKFGRPELFERDQWSKQIHDLQTVAAAVSDGELPGGAGAQTWFGHSRGGVTVLLTAGRAFAPDAFPVTPAPIVQPTSVVAAAASHSSCNLDESIRQIMRDEGHIVSPSSRTGQMLRIGREWLDEIEADPESFDPVRAAAFVACPVFLIHGDNDQTVNVASASKIYEAVPDAVVRIVEGASHTFDSPNPLTDEATPPPNTATMINEVCNFIEGKGES